MDTFADIKAALSIPGFAAGVWGESLVRALLERDGWCVERGGRHGGDLRCVDPDTGETVRVEVKCARPSQHGRNRMAWAFSLVRAGRTDYRHADVLVLVAVMKTGHCEFFTMPTRAICHRTKVTITSTPRAYSGWARVWWQRSLDLRAVLS